MKYTPVFILIGLLCTPEIKSSNILIFIPSPWKSHIVTFQPLFLELAHRGHNVTVVTQFAVKNPPSNYTQVLMKSELPVASTNFIDIILQETNKFVRLFKEIYIRSTISRDITETYISNSILQKFIKEDQSTFDLVIVESFFQECTIAMGHKYGAPVISIIPVAPWVSQSMQAANPLDFSYIKDFVLDSGKSLDFLSRLGNIIVGMYGLLVEPNVYLLKMENMMNKYFQYPGHENRPPLTEMLKNISLSLIDSDIMILTPRPYVPNFIEVPGIHLLSNNDMSEKLLDFMDRAETGVVYFSFGSLLDVALLPKHYLDIFKNVLGRLEQKVIFKWSNNDTQEFPDNFYVDSWLPQLTILKHKNCKAFITHGGIHGLMETIDAGIPILGFPFFGDQFQNLMISQENGFGIKSNIFKITEETFERDIRLLLTDQKFTENAKKMSFIFNDRPMSTIDKAVYWVEYVIRHKGAHHLRSPAVELKWYQYYLLDIAAFFMFVIFICFFIVKRTTIFIYTLIVKPKKFKRS